MIWLVVIGLGVWCILQQQQLGDLTRELDRLRLDLVRLMQRPGVNAATADAMAFVAPPPRQAMPELVQPEPEPQSVAAPAMTSLPLVDLETTTPPNTSSRVPSTPGTLPAAGSISDWLSEKGLAWLGGGALALGGLMLVAYAAKHGVFTPTLRLWSATALGFIALSVGEALRRTGKGEREGGQLVAALTTAAGAAILYGAIWAAHVLYGFIPAVYATVLLAMVSIGLLGLALLHGEAMGALAVIAAYAVPVVSGAVAWNRPPLDAFVLLILITGGGVSELRRWRRVGALSLIGAGVWTLQRLVAGDAAGAATLIIATPLVALGAAGLMPRHVAAGADTRVATLDLADAAVGIASLFSLLVWASFAGAGHPVLAAISLFGVAGAAVVGLQAGVLRPVTLGAPALAVLALTVLIDTDAAARPALGWVLADIAVLALAGVLSGAAGEKRRSAALIGAGASALALTLLGSALSQAAPHWNVAVYLAFAGAFGVGVATIHRNGARPALDTLARAAWIAATAEVVGLALHAGLDGRLLPTAYGLLGAGLSILALRLKWRGFAQSAAIACLTSFGSLLTGPAAAAALNGRSAVLIIALIAGGATAMQAITWRLLRGRKDETGCAEAASTLAILSALLGAFLVIQRFAAPAAGGVGSLDAFTAATFRTLLLLAAGMTLTFRGAATRFGLWRGPAFIALGALHGAVLQGLILHPWWGVAAPVWGPPGLDGLLLGFLTPALMIALAASPMARASHTASRIAIGVAAGFLLIWLATEIRRLFHGPFLALGPFTFSETAAYGLAAFALALTVHAMRSQRAVKLMGLDLPDALTPPVDGVALGIGALVFCDTASPWWGPLSGQASNSILLFALYLLGCGGAAWIARSARLAARPMLARVALAVTGLEVFAFITLLIRFAYHGAAMRQPLQEASLETWTFSAGWAVYGLAILAFGAARRDLAFRSLGLAVLMITTAKVFLFDMATLEGVVRAASFLALGAILLVAALAARRLGAKPNGPTGSTAMGDNR